jgi:hypothetical protein
MPLPDAQIVEPAKRLGYDVLHGLKSFGSQRQKRTRMLGEKFHLRLRSPASTRERRGQADWQTEN